MRAALRACRLDRRRRLTQEASSSRTLRSSASSSVDPLLIALALRRDQLTSRRKLVVLFA
jgi:hypothetical protein